MKFMKCIVLKICAYCNRVVKTAGSNSTKELLQWWWILGMFSSSQRVGDLREVRLEKL